MKKIDLYCIDLNKTYVEKDISGFLFKVIRNISEISTLNLLSEERGKAYEDVLKTRLSSGTFLGFCFIEVATNKVVYARWLRTDAFFHDKYKKEIFLQANEAFTLDSYTAKKYRGLGLHTEMNKRMLNYCKTEMKLVKMFMVIFSGKEFDHLHKTVQELGYRKIDSVTRINFNYPKLIFSKIKKIYV